MTRERKACAFVLALTLAVMARHGVVAATERSTGPLALDDDVIALEVRHEKHPGVDDRHFVQLRDGAGDVREIEVDGAIFDKLYVGAHLTKDRGDSGMRIDARSIAVDPSREAEGLQVAMLLAALPALLAVGLHLLAPWTWSR